MIKIADGLSIENLTKPVEGLLHHAHCSGIIAFEDGELLAVYFHAIKEADMKQAIYGVRKKPNEKEWSIPFVVSKDLKNVRMEGNPVIWIAPDTKKLFLIYITSWTGWATCIMRQKISEDRGKTWSKSKKIYSHISRIPKNPPIILKNQWYLLPATIEFQECTPLFYISKDQGQSWKDHGARILVPEKYWPPKKAEESKFPDRMLDQPTVIQRNDGSIFCLMRAYRPLGKMYETTSNDNGVTWSEPKPSLLPNPDGGFNMIRLQSGNIAIAYNHSSEERNPLSIAISEDDGKTWNYRRNLCEFHSKDKKSPKENFQYPTLFQSPDGMIHVTWSHGYHQKKDENETLISYADIQYTTFSEEWVKEHKYFDDSWEL